eukprot:TRINITY_DN5722_c0_g1_i1.p1 TRINITY_DN5722_c0_g1~~TRINITY_DN5722_c0_g1_i1.p1  ORF type:complete len:485 (-),score=158.66 TRINITY_DN5722_c0_g1_i1:94-1548(-)
MIFLWILGTIVIFAAITLSVALCTGSDDESLLPLTRHDELARERNIKQKKNQERNVTIASSPASSVVKNSIAQRNQISKEDIINLARQYTNHTKFTNPVYLGEIGTRRDKFYFTVQDEKRVPHLMTLISVGEQSLEILKSDKKKAAIQSIINGVKNPFATITNHNEFKKEKGFYVVIRQINDIGSLRDLIHKTRPFKPATEKNVLRRFEATAVDKIALYGKQILEGLLYLKGQGIPFYNVHAGNVLIYINSSNSHTARITDYESDILDQTPKFLGVMKGDASKVLPEVVGFAGILYEIAAGYEMDSYELDDLPREDFAKEVRQLLRSIFKAETPMTLEALADHPFFRNVQLYSDWDGEKITKTDEVDRVLQTISDNARSKVTGTKVTTARKKPVAKTESKSSTITSATTAPAAPAAPAAPPAPKVAAPPPPPPSSSGPPPPPPPQVSSPSGERKNLLSSIESFKAGNLKKTKTVDKSGPKLGMK